MSDCDGSPSTSSSSCRRFSLADIQSATDDFADELVIGQGGFGKVYKGAVTDGEIMTVAVKRLNPRSRQGAREFRTEIEMLSRFRFRYRYLVSLIGYCEEPDEMILVYEYMPRGNFADHLHRSGKNYSEPLPWLRRLRICIDAARGLDYLHIGTSIQPDRAIHRDVKSSNILLDHNWDAKILDFGLSKLGPEDQAYSHVSTEVKGTFGYLDREYYLTRRLTRKSDVYAFGVVMLEALCGRPAVDLSGDEEQWGLAGWTQYCIGEGTVDEIIDPSVKEEIKQDCLMDFVQIAVECLRNFPRKRPTMAEILVRLELALAMQEGNDSSIIVKPAKVNFTRKVQRYFLGTTSVNSDTKPTSKVPRNHSSISNSILPDKDGAMSNNKDGDLAQELPSGGQTPTPSFKQFTFTELKSITKNFSNERILSKGSHVVAFKGWIDEKTYNPSEFGVGMAVVVKEITPNEFQDPGLRQKRIMYSTKFEAWAWVMYRKKEQKMYSKFEATNILLDKDFNAKLSNFGMPELYEACTAAYSGPLDYFPGMEPGGRRVYDSSRPFSESHLVSFARPYGPYLTGKRRPKEIMDARLNGEYPLREASKVDLLAQSCLADKPEAPPSMEEVLEVLKKVSAKAKYM
ncbi:hypothetical protein RJ640_026785 [Escallonia rubra]|uniref:Protein kinase domain-containing protein n=1 Tax=Escallonia rubra TaxID=112253 RepID=A0AA88U595_9ASTE|nr:hypothetical protein RJ640_026785 [Escallonia rubra]